MSRGDDFRKQAYNPGMLKKVPLGALVLCCVACAQILSPNSTGNENKYSLHGTVLDAATGRPVRHALVQLFSQMQHQVFTDGDGRFQINRLSQTRTQLNIIKPGYGPENHQAVEIGPDSAPVIIRLNPLSGIRGNITDQSGEPLDGVPVHLYSFSLENGVWRRHEMPQTQTDEDGAYQFSELPAGDYQVSAGPSWKDLANPFEPGTNPTFVYPQTFFPGVQRVDDAGVVHLGAAKYERADVTLGTATTFIITGAMSGGPSGRWSAQFLNSAGQKTDLLITRVGRDGFRARISGGASLIKVNANDDKNNHFYGQAEVNVTSDIRGLTIALSPTLIPIVAERHSFTDSPASQNDPPPSVKLVPLDPSQQEVRSELQGEPGNWTAAVKRIEFGSYRVEVESGGGWYPDSITYRGTDLRTEPLVYTGETDPIEISLRNDTATLRIQVNPPVDKQDFQATVIATPENAAGQPIVLQVRSSAGLRDYFRSQGGNAIVTLPPGRYSVYAFEDATGLEYGKPDVMKKFASNAATVTLQPRQTTNVTLSLIRRSE